MSVMWENKLVPSSGTYLCSMKGYMCRILTLGGKSPPGKKGIKLRRMRQARAIWMKCNVREPEIKLNKAGKAHDNAFTT